MTTPRPVTVLSPYDAESARRSVRVSVIFAAIAVIGAAAVVLIGILNPLSVQRSVQALPAVMLTLMVVVAVGQLVDLLRHVAQKRPSLWLEGRTLFVRGPVLQSIDLAAVSSVRRRSLKRLLGSHAVIELIDRKGKVRLLFEPRYHGAAPDDFLRQITPLLGVSPPQR